MAGRAYRHYDVKYGDEIYYTLKAGRGIVYYGVVMSRVEARDIDMGYSGDEDEYLYVKTEGPHHLGINVYGVNTNSIVILEKKEEKQEPKIQFFLGKED